jgi:hypothetical protein
MKRLLGLAATSFVAVVTGCVAPMRDPAASNYFLEFVNRADRPVALTVTGPAGADRIRDRAQLAIEPGSTVRQDLYWVLRGQKVELRVKTAEAQWETVELPPAGEGPRVLRRVVIFRNTADGNVAWSVEARD